MLHPPQGLQVAPGSVQAQMPPVHVGPPSGTATPGTVTPTPSTPPASFRAPTPTPIRPFAPQSSIDVSGLPATAGSMADQNRCQQANAVAAPGTPAKCVQVRPPHNAIVSPGPSAPVRMVTPRVYPQHPGAIGCGNAQCQIRPNAGLMLPVVPAGMVTSHPGINTCSYMQPVYSANVAVPVEAVGTPRLLGHDHRDFEIDLLRSQVSSLQRDVDSLRVQLAQRDGQQMPQSPRGNSATYPRHGFGASASTTNLQVAPSPSSQGVVSSAWPQPSTPTTGYVRSFANEHSAKRPPEIKQNAQDACDRIRQLFENSPTTKSAMTYGIIPGIGEKREIGHAFNDTSTIASASDFIAGVNGRGRLNPSHLAAMESPPTGIRRATSTQVHLRRGPMHGEFGFVVVADIQELVVTWIDEKGALQQWNNSNPRRVVLQGDRILSVNGVSGDAQRMRAELIAAPECHLEFQHQARGSHANVAMA